MSAQDKTNGEYFINNIHRNIDRYDIPRKDVKFFGNIFNNQILAVTVKKRQVEKPKYPPKWQEARQKELQSLQKFEVFDVVDRQEVPENHPDPIGFRWLYILKDYPFDEYQKDNPEAEVGARYKARLIAQGMNEEIDDTYSPTPTAE